VSRPHVPAGRVNGVHAPVGTVLGPKVVTKEFVVVTGEDELGVTVGYARLDEVDASAIEAIIERGPNSVTEHQMISGYQHDVRRRLRALFGGVR